MRFLNCKTDFYRALPLEKQNNKGAVKKVPKEKRNNIWIVKDKNNNILWIPKLYLNQTLKGDNKIYLKYEEENDK